MKIVYQVSFSRLRNARLKLIMLSHSYFHKNNNIFCQIGIWVLNKFDFVIIISWKILIKLAHRRAATASTDNGVSCYDILVTATNAKIGCVYMDSPRALMYNNEWFLIEHLYFVISDK